MEQFTALLFGVFLGTLWITAVAGYFVLRGLHRAEKLRRCQVWYFDQSDSLRDEKMHCRIKPEGIYVGYEENEFIPMSRVARVFIYKSKIPSK